MATLDSVFKNVFGEGLAPYGFVKINGRYPYFARLISDEIIHIITYRTDWSGRRGYKAFNILGGVATVYRQSVNLTITPKDNLNWLTTVSQFYAIPNLLEYDRELCHSIQCFYYKLDDESLNNEIERSFEAARHFMLPILNRVTNLESCIEYFRTFNSQLLNIYDSDFENENPTHYCYEGLLLIKTHNHDDGAERMKRTIERTAELMKRKMIGLTQTDFEKECELLNKVRLEQLTIRNKLFDDPKLYNKVLGELECRKKANTEILRSYGLKL